MVSREKKIEERRRKRNMIASVVLAGLMLMGIVGFAFQGNVTSSAGGPIELNGYEFITQNVEGGQVLVTQVDGEEFFFYGSPYEAQNVVSPINFAETIRSADIISFAYGEISEDERQGAVEEALLSDFSVATDAVAERAQVRGADRGDLSPVRSCEDATSENVVLLLNETVGSIYPEILQRDDNCFVIKGYGFDLLTVRDYLLLLELDII